MVAESVVSANVILSKATLAPYVICLANHAGENLRHYRRDPSLMLWVTSLRKV